jgi:hypothetical protein
MVELNDLTVTVAINSANILAENRDKFFKSFEQDVSQNCPLQMSPQPLDHVQTWAVRSQPVDHNPVGTGCEPFLGCSCVVETTVVTNQPSFSSAVRLHQRAREYQEIRPTLAAGDCIYNLIGRVIEAPMHNLLLVLAWRWEVLLYPHWRPHRRQSWIPMNPHFVLRDECFRGVLHFFPKQPPYDRCVSSFVAFPLYSVLGTMDRIAFLMQKMTHLVAAEADPSHFRQMDSESNGRPCQEANSRQSTDSLRRFPS